jgi:hypothetical protein
MNTEEAQQPTGIQDMMAEVEALEPAGDAAEVVKGLEFLLGYARWRSTRPYLKGAIALIQQQARQAIADELEERSLRAEIATLTERCEEYDKVLEKCAELNGWGASTHALTERQRLQEQTDESG